MAKTFLADIPILGRVKHCLAMVRGTSLKNKVVVDIGSSFGWLEGKIKDSGAKKIIGIDPNPEAVEFAKKHFGKFADFKVGDALNIPLESAVADIVVFFDVIEHVPANGEEKALKEINRILKPNGILLLTTPNSHILANLFDPVWYLGHRHYETSEIKKLLRNGGFKTEELVIKGGFVSVLYMFSFYVLKWIFQQKQPSRVLQKLDDNSYESKNGFVTHFVRAKKV